MSLIFENVTKSFLNANNKGVTQALSDINLEIEEGEFVSIVGPSGCGKSTILRLVAGLLKPTTGRILLNGEEIYSTSSNRGMAFQKPTLFPWLTVKENIEFGFKMKHTLDKNEEKVHNMIEMVGLSEFKDSYPHMLSGGMAQRVALVRTMINEPEIFLLDEPLGALDAFTRMNIQDELLNLWRKNKNTMIMVTHDVDEAIYMGSRILVMAPRPGRIIEDIKINMEHPKNRISKSFLEYRLHILELLDFGENEIE